jgi:hypothetical protein
MEFVSWDDVIIPTEWKNKIHVPNHQPDIINVIPPEVRIDGYILFPPLQ